VKVQGRERKESVVARKRKHFLPSSGTQDMSPERGEFGPWSLTRGARPTWLTGRQARTDLDLTRGKELREVCIRKKRNAWSDSTVLAVPVRFR